MPDWDENSEPLLRNLTQVLRRVRDQARAREMPDREMIREWHRATMSGLDVPNPDWVAVYRGEPGAERVKVTIGAHEGVPSSEVGSQLREFQERLHAVLSRLDGILARDQEPDSDQLAAVMDTCAWAHSEWVRIHPFANGNGRTARLLANAIAMRYGLPPFIRLRPRPDGGYGAAGEAAMRGDWQPTALVFRTMLRNFPEE